MAAQVWFVQGLDAHMEMVAEWLNGVERHPAKSEVATTDSV